MERPIVTKFGVRLETKPRCISEVHGRGTSTRAQVQMCPFPYLGNDWTDCDETFFDTFHAARATCQADFPDEFTPVAVNFLLN